jgi:tRNA(Ile)-lysidine synthase TilS/MesJ
MKPKDAISIQFTGGKDSVLATLLMAKEYRKIYLLTFVHSLIINQENVHLNVQKLQATCKNTEFQHVFVPIEELFQKLLTGRYFRDILKYKMYWACSACGACRLAQHTWTILFNLEHGIRAAADGANGTGFDLSQQYFCLEKIQKFYEKNGMIYRTPVREIECSDIELLKYALEDDVPIFFGSQPKCKGGGEFHNLLLRAIFLPLHKRQGYQKIATEWLSGKLDMCQQYINARPWTSHPPLIQFWGLNAYQF